MTESTRSPAAALYPLVAVVFFAFIVVGTAIPVLPLHVTGKLGLSAFAVGLVSGAQFAAALVSRLWSGRFADRRGGKRALSAGLVAASIAGCLYLVSMAVDADPLVSVSILILGRALLGAGESFVVMGALSWAIAVAGAGNTGRVMSWVGMAMYVGFALGGPLGAVLYAWHGFSTIALVTVAIPACAWVAAQRLHEASNPEGATRSRSSAMSVLRAVWLPGAALAFSSVGFGTLTTFAPLLLGEKHWGQPWAAFSAFSLTFVLARLFLGHLPDRVSGAKIAAICVLVEGLGQWMVWQAEGLPSMLAGSTLTGLGYSLVYPALGVEAVKDALAASKSLAMGTYTAFLDLMLGIGNPILGLVAGQVGVQAVFALGAATAVCSAVIAVALQVRTWRRPSLKAPA